MVSDAFSTSGFTIERLRTFCRIAEAGSIAAAAQNDPTRQSQFSRQVKELEEFFGTKLLERSGKTAQLTEPGRKLALITQSYFREIEDLRASSSKDNVIRIGAAESILRWMLMPRLTELQGLSPGVTFELLPDNTQRCVAGVKEGHLDLAIVRKDAADGSLKALSCGSFKYGLVVPRSLLPGKTAAGFRHLERIPFALLTGDGALASGVRSLSVAMGVALDVRVKAENFTLLISAMENNDLAAVVPVLAIGSLSKERFAVVELEEMRSLTRDLVLLYSPEAAALREIVRRLAPRISELLRK